MGPAYCTPPRAPLFIVAISACLYNYESRVKDIKLDRYPLKLIRRGLAAAEERGCTYERVGSPVMLGAKRKLNKKISILVRVCERGEV